MRNLSLTFFFLTSFLVTAQEDTVYEATPDTTYYNDYQEGPTFGSRLPADTTVFSGIDADRVQKIRFRKDFRERYSSPAFSYEEKKPEKSPWDRFVSWLNRKLREWFGLRDTKSSASIIEYTGKALVILTALAVAYIIARALLRKEGRWIFSRTPKQAGFRYEDAVLNIENADFSKLIEDAVASGDRRLATRYHYLELLKEMSRRDLITFDREKTNTEYLYEIRDEALRKRFSYLSYLYNYIWYGKFEVDETTYAKTAAAFRDTIATLS